MIVDAHIPRNPASTIGPSSSVNIPKVNIVKKISMKSDVTTARCMKHKPSVVAVKTSTPEVYVFRCDENNGTGSFDPDMTLRGLKKEGYGLSWSPLKQGHLLGSSSDTTICLWDINASQDAKILNPESVFKGHNKEVGDVSWHWKDENLFGSVGDDGKLNIWDTRTKKPKLSTVFHKREVNYLSFDPFSETVVATASSDATVGVFDLRNLKSPFHVLHANEEVSLVKWHPNHKYVLASAVRDKTLMVWDLSRIGDEELKGETKDAPIELLFSHCGHKADISDFSWNINQPWIISSVAWDNSLQIWRMDESIYQEAGL